MPARGSVPDPGPQRAAPAPVVLRALAAQAADVAAALGQAPAPVDSPVDLVVRPGCEILKDPDEQEVWAFQSQSPALLRSAVEGLAHVIRDPAKSLAERITRHAYPELPERPESYFELPWEKRYPELERDGWQAVWTRVQTILARAEHVIARAAQRLPELKAYCIGGLGRAQDALREAARKAQEASKPISTLKDPEKSKPFQKPKAGGYQSR